MSEIINLRRARKAKARAESEKAAAANRTAHGTPKQLRDLQKARTRQAAQKLENSRLDDPRETDK